MANVIIKENLPVKTYMGNKCWTSEEEKQLRDELELDTDISEIASNHERTIVAIISRIKKIASYDEEFAKVKNVEKYIPKPKSDGNQIVKKVNLPYSGSPVSLQAETDKGILLEIRDLLKEVIILLKK